MNESGAQPVGMMFIILSRFPHVVGAKWQPHIPVTVHDTMEGIVSALTQISGQGSPPMRYTIGVIMSIDAWWVKEKTI